MIKFNNEQIMLADKTELLNRLEYSGCTIKSNFAANTIKSPYIVQYKIFEERLKNPKMKTMSMVMRKRKYEDLDEKQNVQTELKQFQEDQCLKQARKIVNKEETNFTLFPTNTIDYDVNQNSKQSEVMFKFRQKLLDLKLIKNLKGTSNKSRISTMSFANQTQKYQRSQIASSIGSHRSKNHQLKPLTAQVFNHSRNRKASKDNLLSSKNSNDKKLKLPLTFLTYKRNKSFAERFNKDQK